MQESNGKAIASLVLGILSVIFIFTGQFSFIGIILGIIGLVLGINAKKESPANAGTATAGIVLSIVSIAICAITFLACVACVGLLGIMSYSY